MPSLYDMSIPLFLRALNNQRAFLHKAEQHCSEHSIPAQKILNARLVEDMKPLPFQIQSASNTAKFVTVRLAGIDNEAWDDNETTFEELYARIDKTVAFLQAAKAEHFEGKEGKEVVMKIGGEEVKFTGLSYLQTFALPNFFFHHTAAYAILRNQGVPVGKFD